MRRGKGYKLRPTVEREGLYRLVLELRKEGLSYNQIIARVETEHGVTLRKSHVSGWINGKHKPFGYVRAFDAKPCPELAYVIGVGLGDASTSTNRAHSYMIKLRVTDREFAMELSRCLGALLGRSPPSVKWNEKTRSWHTQVSSLLLQKLLRQEVKELATLVSHCDDCKAAFLRGFRLCQKSVLPCDSGIDAVPCSCVYRPAHVNCCWTGLPYPCFRCRGHDSVVCLSGQAG